VILPDSEMAEIRRLARREQMTVGDWVRRALRARFKLGQFARRLSIRSPLLTLIKCFEKSKNEAPGGGTFFLGFLDFLGFLKFPPYCPTSAWIASSSLPASDSLPCDTSSR
jgi:hypothetical protein